MFLHSSRASLTPSKRNILNFYWNKQALEILISTRHLPRTSIHHIPSRKQFIRSYSERQPALTMTSTPSVPKHLNFITGNKNKLAEVQAILEGVIELRNENVDLVEIQGTVEEVTTDKARRAAEVVRITSLALYISSPNHTSCPNLIDESLIVWSIYSANNPPSPDQRPRPSRRYMPLLQSHE